MREKVREGGRKGGREGGREGEREGYRIGWIAFALSKICFCEMLIPMLY